MDEFIKRNKLIRRTKSIKHWFLAPLIIKEIKNAPAEAVVSIELYRKIQNERDMAFKLLHQNGIEIDF